MERGQRRGMDVYARWTSLSRARILIVVASVLVAYACVAASQSVSTAPDVTTCTPLVVQSKLSTLEYNSGGKRLVAIDDQPREDFVKRYKEGEDVAPKPRARGGWFGRRADATEEDPDEEEAPPPPPAPVSGDPTRYPVHVFDYSFRDTYVSFASSSFMR